MRPYVYANSFHSFLQVFYSVVHFYLSCATQHIRHEEHKCEHYWAPQETQTHSGECLVDLTKLSPRRKNTAEERSQTEAQQTPPGAGNGCICSYRVRGRRLA